MTKYKQTSFDLLQNLRCHTIKQNKKIGQLALAVLQQTSRYPLVYNNFLKALKE